MLNTIKYYLLTSFVTVGGLLAQDTKHDVNIDINSKGGEWYSHWWVWGVVAILFIITIVALVSRGGGSTRRA